MARSLAICPAQLPSACRFRDVLVQVCDRGIAEDDDRDFVIGQLAQPAPCTHDPVRAVRAPRDRIPQSGTCCMRQQV